MFWNLSDGKDEEPSENCGSKPSQHGVPSEPDSGTGRGSGFAAQPVSLRVRPLFQVLHAALERLSAAGLRVHWNKTPGGEGGVGLAGKFPVARRWRTGVFSHLLSTKEFILFWSTWVPLL